MKKIIYILTVIFIFISCENNCKKSSKNIAETDIPNLDQIFNDLKNNNVEYWDNNFDGSDKRTFKEDFEKSDDDHCRDLTIKDKIIKNDIVEFKLTANHSHGGRYSWGDVYITAIYQLVNNNWKLVSAIQTLSEGNMGGDMTGPHTDLSNSDNHSKEKKKEELPICQWCEKEIRGDLYFIVNEKPRKIENWEGRPNIMYHQKCAYEKCEKSARYK